MWKKKLVCCFILIHFLFNLYGCGPQNIRKVDFEEILDTSRLKFMTFNIRVGGGAERPGVRPDHLRSSKEKLERIVEAIKYVDPDIIAMQKVKGGYQARFIAKKLNLNYSYTPHGHYRFDWGLAVLSKYKIVKSKSRMILMGSGVSQTRQAGIHTISINGKEVTIVNVHYHIGQFNSQVGNTMAILNKIDGPHVLMGDLNRKPYHSEIKVLQEKLITTCEAVDTICEGTGFGKIDYIFVDRINFDVLDVGVLKFSNPYRKHYLASDHYAYYAEVKFK